LVNKPSEKNGSVLAISGRAVRVFNTYQIAMTVDGSDADRRKAYHAKSSRGIGAEIIKEHFGGIASAGLRHEVSKYKEANPSFQHRQREDKTTTATASFSIGLTPILPSLDHPPRIRFSVRYGKTKSTIDEFSKYAGEALVLFVQPI